MKKSDSTRELHNYEERTQRCKLRGGDGKSGATNIGGEFDVRAFEIVQDALGVDALGKRGDAACDVERDRNLRGRFATVPRTDCSENRVVDNHNTVELCSSAQRGVPASRTRTHT